VVVRLYGGKKKADSKKDLKGKLEHKKRYLIRKINRLYGGN
jgi:hypothetical protein